MFRFIRSLFSSPESLLEVLSVRDIKESIEEDERIIIDQDGGASVNLNAPEVHQDFSRHVNTLKRA